MVIFVLDQSSKGSGMVAPEYRANKKLNWTIGKKKKAILKEPFSSDAFKVSRKEKAKLLQNKLNER